MLEDENGTADEKTVKIKNKMKNVIAESKIICKPNPEDM